MLKGFKKLFTTKNLDLDNDGKVESYREEIKGVFSQFKRVSEKLEEVNAKLHEIIEDELFATDCEKDNLKRIIEASELKIKESELLVETVRAELEANKKLKEKVEEFIV